MKRFFALLLALLMLSPAALAEATLAERACDLARLLDEMASSAEYVSLMSGSEEIGAQASAWGAGDHDAPVAIYALSVDPQAMLLLVGTELEGITADWSDGLVRHVEKQLLSSLSSILNGRYGAVTLAAASVCRASVAFPCDGLTADTAYILLYQDAVPVMVCFAVEEDGVVSACASFLAGEQAAAMVTAEDAAALLTGLPVQVEPVALP